MEMELTRKSSITAACVLFFSTFGAADIVINGRNPVDVLIQCRAALRRQFMPSRPIPVSATRALGGHRFPPLQQPAVEPPDTDVVADLADVIGVSSGGQHRAYAVQVMTSPRNRVINDVIGDTRIVVMYNPADDCARVLIGRSQEDGYVTLFHVFENGPMEIEID